jgi:hypothetical protein
VQISCWWGGCDLPGGTDNVHGWERVADWMQEEMVVECAVEKLVRQRGVLNATHGSTIDRENHHLLEEEWCCTTHGTQCKRFGILSENGKQASICLPSQ